MSRKKQGQGTGKHKTVPCLLPQFTDKTVIDLANDRNYLNVVIDE